jgi:hypothetical protein
LTQLNAKAADEGRAGGDGVEYGDVFNDFATEDFISKNIRVRPVSGFTVKDETKDGRQSNISKAIVQSEGNEEGEGKITHGFNHSLLDNYHKFAVLELEDQRKAIKTQ